MSKPQRFDTHGNPAIVAASINFGSDEKPITPRLPSSACNELHEQPTSWTAELMSSNGRCFLLVLHKIEEPENNAGQN